MSAVTGNIQKEGNDKSLDTQTNLLPKAQDALRGSPVYALREISVVPKDDQLHIIGEVGSFYHKQLAQEVVRSVTRGTQLVNLIDVAVPE